MPKAVTPPACEPLTLTLSPEASVAVRLYHERTGREPVDIASGILAKQINGAMDYSEQTHEDGWTIISNQVEGAARLRLGRAREKPLASGRPAPAAEAPSCVEVTLSLPKAAHGLLAAMAAYNENSSVAACIMSEMAEVVSGWCERLSDARAADELFPSGEVIVKKEQS